jgi:hypothetical protein
LNSESKIGEVERLVSGFDFVQGITADSKGHIYFCETRKKRIYQWSAETNNAKILADYPLQQFALATDSKDNLLVVFRYDPQPGFILNEKQENVKRLPDDNAAYSSYGNGDWAAYCYSIDPKHPEETFTPMKRVANSDFKNPEKTFYTSSRWNYTFDKASEYFPDSAFVAPDGVTFIQGTYDIGCCAHLSAAVPWQAIYASDEISKRTVKMDIDSKGKLMGINEILPCVEKCNIVDNEGILYVADGQIFVYEKNLKEIKRINIPERPISMAFGGGDGNTPFITTLTSLYSVILK